MADFEDANSPTWENVVEGQVNLRDASRHDLARDPEGKRYRSNDERRDAARAPARLAPARAPRARRRRADLGALFDFGLYFFHNAEELLDAGSGPVLLPAEAGEPPRGAAVERRVHARRTRSASRAARSGDRADRDDPAAFEMEEILYELREHSAGLNAGRWDYIFSVIKKFRDAGPSSCCPTARR
jgi:malate synthase